MAASGPTPGKTLDQATAQKLEKNFLTCSVCFEVYTKPKCLPCLHTFCSHCLLHYIRSQDMYGIRGKMGFPCPMCKQVATIRNNHVPYEQWLDELPNNFLIQNMIDCLNLDSGVQDEVEVDDDVTDDESAPLTIPPPPVDASAPPPYEAPSRPNSMSGDTQFSFLARMLSVENAMNRPGAFQRFQNEYDNIRTGLRQAEEHMFCPAPQPPREEVSLSSLVMSNPIITQGTSISTQKTYDMTARNWADYKPPKVSDVISLPKRNSIVVLDWDNRCVKYVKDFYLNRNVCTAFEVVGRPCSVALLDKEHEDRIVLSLLNRNRLYFIRVPELTLIDVMETTRTYRGITVISPSCFMAASPGSPSAVDLFTIDRRCKMTSSKRIFVNVFSPLYMTLISTKAFAVSDNNKNVLSVYELQGTDTAVRKFAVPQTGMSKFKSLGGICYHDRSIYAVDHDKDEVYKITMDGDVKCDVILTHRQGVYRPSSVCVGPRGELVVTNWEGHVSLFKQGGM